MEEKNPKVFISYSQDSVDFADKVLNFSNKLRQEGIDAILDQYEEAPPEGWPRWMETNIEESDYVLIIGSSGYLDKTTGKVGLGVGRGVKWESNLIYQKLYESDTLNPKFIPVVFDNDDLKFIPLPLRGSTYYNVSSDKGFDKLYWRLRGVSTKQKPPLGKLRPLPEKERKTLYVTSMIDIDTWDKATWRGVAFFMFEDEPPILLLPFINEEYAKKIFEDWISIVGTEDKNNDIRVALVEGDVPNEEKGYYIVIGNDLDEAVKRAENQGYNIDELLIINVSRIIRANPRDNFQAFNLFKSHYLKFNSYELMPAIVNDATGKIKPLAELSIKKTKLIYKNIKDIDENDQDAILLDKNKPFKKYKNN